MTEQSAKKNQHLVPVILWAALIMSVVMYLGMTFMLPRTVDLPSVPVEQTTETPTDPSADGVVHSEDPMAKILYPFGLAMALAGLALGHARSLWKDAATAIKLHIISLALCESCALMGFMIFLTGKGDATEPRSMMIVAVVCMVTLFPTPKRMRLA